MEDPETNGLGGASSLERGDRFPSKVDRAVGRAREEGTLGGALHHPDPVRFGRNIGNSRPVPQFEGTLVQPARVAKGICSLGGPTGLDENGNSLAMLPRAIEMECELGRGYLGIVGAAFDQVGGIASWRWARSPGSSWPYATSWSSG